jgi:polyisoprenoid-binding protein YceI
MKKILLISLVLSSALNAAPTSFDFKDPKGVNAIQFSLDSLLEPISGNGSGVSGLVSFDPANVGATTGKIVVTTASLTVSNSMMTDHLRGEKWLNASVHPEIVFELVKLDNIQTSGTTTTATAAGKFTLNGVTKSLTVPVKLTHLAGAFGKRLNKPEIGGDLLVIRGEFTINRSDYAIMPGQMEDKVNPEIKLTLAIVGSAPKA